MESKMKENPDFSIEEVAKRPLPGTAAPLAFRFSPDNQFITYLHSPDSGLVRQLFLFDPQTNQHEMLVRPPGEGTTEDNISLEEKLRRERAREIGLGVTRYFWAKKADRILIPQPDGLYIQDGRGAELRKIAGSPAVDPQISADGQWVAFVRNAEIYVVPADGGQPHQVTSGARGTGKTNGLAEYIAQEEMARSHGFWWSPDAAYLAFVEVDETHIPVYRIVHQGKDATGQTAQEDHRYPFAGQANAKVRLGVVSIDGGDPVWMDLGQEEDIYLARVGWLPDGALSAQIQNREQTELKLARFDPATGAGTLLLEETTEVWINLHHGFRPLSNPKHDGRFIWASEKTGFLHLYLHDKDGNLLRPLTEGEWQVDALVGVDEKNETVYFTGTLDTPTEMHLYRVSFEGGPPERITQAPGIHQVVIDKNYTRFVDVHSSLDNPPSVSLCDLSDGSKLAAIYDQRDPRIDQLDLQAPELVSFDLPDGTPLHGAVYRPPEKFGAGPYPTIVFVYGGPHAQLVTNGWGPTVYMRSQYLRQQGFLVFVLDNRGSARRGLAFEGALKHDMGNIEVQDQVAGIRWLVEQGLADPEKVGIYGWSYGGYMSLMCLACAPETFKVAVAGAPVTHWDGYDTHYTERYMGLPAANPSGYTESSVMHHVDKLEGKLMLVHGLIDENVHFRHTARLVNALIRARKTYQLLLFPDERHLPRKLEDRVFMEEQIRDFFLQHLQ